MSVGVATSGQRVRRDVQGLRALAVVAVVGYHYHFWPFTNGYAGVDIFFVISGFVITRLLWSERDGIGSNSLVAFYARRLRRIVPAATLTIVGTIIGAWMLVGAASALSTAHDALAAMFFYANVHFAQQATNYLSANQPQSPLVHFWSLSIEEQYYFVWPSLFIGLVALGRRHRRTVVLVALAVVAIAAVVYSVHATAENQNAAYYSSFIRAGELALGALVATAEPLARRIAPALRSVVGWSGLAAAIASVTAWGSITSFPGAWVLLPTLGTAAVIVAGVDARRFDASNVAGWGPLVWLGGLSYSLYLWHWPIYDLVALRLGHAPSLASRFGLLMVALVLALLSYYLVESPLRRATTLRARPMRTVLVGGAFVVASLTTAVTVMAATTGEVLAAPTPLTTRSLGVALERASSQSSLPRLVVPLAQMGSDVAYAGFDRGCLVAYNAASAMGGRPSDCFFGDTASTRTLVLMGDSNADMWLPAFDALGRTDHFRVELVARASCQLPDLALWDPVLHRPGTECSAFRRAAFRLIATVHPFATVLVDYEYGIRWNDEDQPYSPSDSARGITNTVRAVARHSGRVVMLGEPPAQFSDPVTCLETHEHNIAACDSPRVCATSLASTSSKCTFDPTTGRTWAYLPLLAHAVASGGGTYVPVTTLFCTPRACPSVVDHVVVMFDLRHVSEHYGELVAPALGTLLQRAGVPL